MRLNWQSCTRTRGRILDTTRANGILRMQPFRFVRYHTATTCTVRNERTEGGALARITRVLVGPNASTWFVGVLVGRRLLVGWARSIHPTKLVQKKKRKKRRGSSAGG